MRRVTDVENDAKNITLLNEKIFEAAQMKKAFEEMEEAFKVKKAEAEALMSRLKLKEHSYDGINVKFVEKEENIYDVVEFSKLVSPEVFMSCVKVMAKESKENVIKPLHDKFIKKGEKRTEFHLTLPKAKVIV